MQSIIAGTCAVGLGALGAAVQAGAALNESDDDFLDELEKRSFQFFWENAHPETGLVKDRSKADGPDKRNVASIAATGFGLTALCIGHRRRWRSIDEIRSRVATTLRFLHTKLPHEHGFFYHFVDDATGRREWKCELSSIDTALLLCGVLTCRAYFDNDREIRETARKIYERVDWQWMMNGGQTLSHGWKPESGFLKARWDEYCEHMMLYLLAFGSPTHPISAEAWHAWKRPWMEYAGIRFINPRAPLFIHQFSHAWFDFQGKRDRYTDYFDNSVKATRAHKQFCLSLRDRYPHYAENMWGITSSDSAHGYEAWGGPPELGRLDGSLVPCAAAGSLPFLRQETLAVLKQMRATYGERVWKRYGFVDAFNPATGWFAPDVIGIDVGITLLMAENARTGFVWRVFMRNEEARKGMRVAGFAEAKSEGRKPKSE